MTFDTGRPPNEVFDDFTEAHAARMEQLGLNALRLPVSWSGLEPEPRAYQEAFFSRIAQILAMAHEHHFYVLIDMHQDAYSKWIGNDGQPLWTITPPPDPSTLGASPPNATLSGPALAAGYNFFANDVATDGRPLQAAYIAAVEQVVTRFLGDSAVLGFEAFNEPVVLKQSELDTFHGALADAIHSVDRDAPMLFEPVATRNELDSAVVPTSPFSHMPGAYAPHIYTAIFSMPQLNDWAGEDPSVLAPSMAAANREVIGWGTPLFVTEFGCDQSTPQGPVWISAELDLQDQYLASSTIWEFSDKGGWGFYANDGSEQPRTSTVVSRSFPRAVAGDLVFDLASVGRSPPRSLARDCGDEGPPARGIDVERLRYGLPNPLRRRGRLLHRRDRPCDLHLPGGLGRPHLRGHRHPGPGAEPIGVLAAWDARRNKAKPGFRVRPGGGLGATPAFSRVNRHDFVLWRGHSTR